MILLITSSPRAHDFMEALKSGTGEQVELAVSLEEGAHCVRHEDYSALVIDEAAASRDTVVLTSLLRHSGSAVPVFLQFAISSSQRMLQEVKTALRRRHKEHRVALETVRLQLRDELRGKVTGILLCSELALSEQQLTPFVQAKLREVSELAQEMQRRLKI